MHSKNTHAHTDTLNSQYWNIGSEAIVQHFPFYTAFSSVYRRSSFNPTVSLIEDFGSSFSRRACVQFYHVTFCRMVFLDPSISIFYSAHTWIAESVRVFMKLTTAEIANKTEKKRYISWRLFTNLIHSSIFCQFFQCSNIFMAFHDDDVEIHTTPESVAKCSQNTRKCDNLRSVRSLYQAVQAHLSI